MIAVSPSSTRKHETYLAATRAFSLAKDREEEEESEKNNRIITIINNGYLVLLTLVDIAKDAGHAECMGGHAVLSLRDAFIIHRR